MSFQLFIFISVCSLSPASSHMHMESLVIFSLYLSLLQTAPLSTPQRPDTTADNLLIHVVFDLSFPPFPFTLTSPIFSWMSRNYLFYHYVHAVSIYSLSLFSTYLFTIYHNLQRRMESMSWIEKKNAKKYIDRSKINVCSRIQLEQGAGTRLGHDPRHSDEPHNIVYKKYDRKKENYVASPSILFRKNGASQNF